MTVVIPVWEGHTNEEWLREAMDSVREGTPVWVCRNDGDLAGSFNRGVADTSTEFVMRLDADDVLDLGALDILMGLSENADVVYPSLLLVEDGEPIELLKAPEFCPNRLMTKNFIPGCALIRRDLFLQVGGYRDLEILEDWDLYVRLYRAGARFKSAPEATVLYRQHGVSRNKVVDPVATHERMREMIVGDVTSPSLATWYYQDSPATSYWRCLLPARELGQAQYIPHARVVQEDDGELGLRFDDHVGGAAVWQFPGSQSLGVYLAEMQSHGTRVLVEVDDNYTIGVPAGTNNAWAIKRGHAQYSYEYHTKLVKWVDGVIVTTPHLAKVYGKLNDNVFVCPNQIDPADWPEPDYDRDVFRIGWSASPSHVSDVRLVRRAFEWASTRCEVTMLGLNPRFDFRYWQIPWTNDLDAHRRLQGLLTIGVCPLVENPWSVCKSDVKVLEYAMAGACPVYSDAIPYVDVPDDVGFRVRDAKGFYHVIKHLVAHPDEAVAAARHAREWALSERTVSGNAWRWKEAIDGNEGDWAPGGSLAEAGDSDRGRSEQERSELEPV